MSFTKITRFTEVIEVRVHPLQNIEQSFNSPMQSSTDCASCKAELQCYIFGFHISIEIHFEHFSLSVSSDFLYKNWQKSFSSFQVISAVSLLFLFPLLIRRFQHIMLCDFSHGQRPPASTNRHIHLGFCIRTRYQCRIFFLPHRRLSVS